MANPPKPLHMDASVYDKLVQDNIPVPLKDAIIGLCGSCTSEHGADDTTVEQVFNAYCFANQDTGASIALGPNETVGHIKLLDSTALHLSRRLSVDRDRIEALFRALAGERGPSQLEDAQEWFADMIQVLDADGNALVISGPVCWLFRDEATEDATNFFTDSPECLPCRLGLPTILNEMPPYPHGLDFLGMAVKSSNVSNARDATVFHGDYVSVRDIWLPGGYTQPISMGPAYCVALGGVREFVATPPAYHQIDPSFRILTT
ncbi:hypothetical protein [Novosphingobium sp. P6W]|uniref:hypothetical protein n=1 Tax=Novosphingobium sp. P6W TaxID=1609758 RepID=UPI000B17336C|nr:hypothetical protein [Novosphingobium sp. P6W]